MLQNSTSALLGRATRSTAAADDLYSINHFIVASECAKFIFSLLLEMRSKMISCSKLCCSVRNHITRNPWDAMKSVIPAALYLMSNTLQYIALTNLTAPVFQVLYQAKLVTTALTSVAVFKRRYSLQQWICIVGLSLGVAIVVIGEQSAQQTTKVNTALGVLAIAVASLLSAFAGVYFEKILKQEKQHGNGPSLWMRNAMLSFFSILIGLPQGMIQDFTSSEKPYFHGFTTLVWVQVCLLASGGLIVAAVIKHADNVIKGLATGLSVVLSTATSIMIFSTPLTNEFLIGSCIILASVYFFSNPASRLCEKSFVGAGLIITSVLPFVLMSATSMQNYPNDQSTQEEIQYKIVDVISFGSMTRPQYQKAQAKTWGSHTSIRNFFAVDESHDYDKQCTTDLTADDAYAISAKCKTRNFGSRHGRPRDSPLQHFERNVFARQQFLEKKSNPIGWLCCMPRPTLGLAAFFEHYSSTDTSNDHLPDYLIITDDDTYFNMNIFHRELGNKPTDTEPEGYAGCLIRHPFHQIKFTFPHGGFGVILSKAALKNLVEPILCNSGNQSFFVTSACNRLQQPQYDEAQLFHEGMTLIDLMVQYVTFQPYSQYLNWTTGFCQHGDWLWGYFFQYYNVTNHVIEAENLRAVGENRLHSYLGSSIYKSGTGNCLNEREKCNQHSGVCHYQSPELMESVNKKVGHTQSANSGRSHLKSLQPINVTKT